VAGCRRNRQAPAEEVNGDSRAHPASATMAMI
jgi:hypothetical protein